MRTKEAIEICMQEASRAQSAFARARSRRLVQDCSRKSLEHLTDGFGALGRAQTACWHVAETWGHDLSRWVFDPPDRDEVEGGLVDPLGDPDLMAQEGGQRGEVGRAIVGLRDAELRADTARGDFADACGDGWE